jgi:phosphoglycerate-specific signal transduction histidine kinase
MQEVINLPDLFFDEEKLNILKDNTDKILEGFSSDEKESLIAALKSDLQKIEEIIAKINELPDEN